MRHRGGVRRRRVTQPLLAPASRRRRSEALASPQDSPDACTLASELRDSERRVLMFRGQDVLNGSISRFLRQPKLVGRPTLVCLALLGLGLGALAGVSAYFAHSVPFANVDAAIYLLVTGLMFVWSRASWRAFLELDEALDRLITDDEERKRAVRMFSVRLHRLPQVLIALLGMVVGGMCAALAIRAEHDAFVADLPFFASMLTTGALGASVVYWLWAGVTFLNRLATFQSVALCSEHEGHPLIRGVYAIVAKARLQVGAGLFLSELPLVLLAYTAPRSGFLIAATAGVLVLCSATLAAISLAPDIYLGRICRTSQDAEIRELERRRRELMLKHDLDEFMADAALREAITAIRSRPVRRLSAATFANVTAAVVTALAPFVALYLQFGPHL